MVSRDVSVAIFCFGGASSEEFTTLRNSWDKIGHTKSVGFRFESAI